MDFKTLSPAYLTSLCVIFCGALLIGTSNPWLLWLGWILLILALGLNVLAFVLSVGKAKGDPTPALVTNLDGLESSVENRIRERSEHRREEHEAAEHEAVEHEAAAQANQEVASRVRLLTTAERPSLLKLQRSARKSPPNLSRLLPPPPAV